MKFLFLFSVLILTSNVSCSHKTPSVVNSTYKSFGLDSVTKENLKKYASPELESSLKGQIALYMDIQPQGAGLLNPQNTNEFFFGWGISGNTQVWKMNGPKSFPQQLTGGKDSTSLMDITLDGKYLILQRDIDGQENPGIYLQSTQGGPLIKLFHKPKVKASYQFISDDAKYLFYSTNEEVSDSFFIYKMDLATKEVEKIWSEKGLWSVIDHEGDRILLSYQKGNTSNEVIDLNLKTKEHQNIIGQNKEEEYDVAFLKNGKDYLVLTSEFSNYKTLYTLKSGKFSPLTSALTFDVDKFKLNRKRTFLSLEINKDGYTHSDLHKVSADGALTPFSLPKFEQAEHVRLGFGRSDDFIIISASSYNSPRITYSFNSKSKVLQQWNLPSTPELQLSEFVPAKLEHYTTRDQVKIPMFVRRSKKCELETCPVVVLFHGGPEAQSLPGFSSLAQLFSENDFIFVEPNVRGSSGYGKEWLHSDNGPKRESVITDIEDCSLWIKKNWSKNHQIPKVGIFGWSYGGYSTLMGMTYFAGSYDVGVSNVGMSNLVTFLENTAPYRRKVRESEYGFLDKDLFSLKKLSPINYIDKVKGPLLIIQGANDPRVPVGEAIQMHEAMEKKGLASQLIIFANEGHGTSKKENRILEWGHTLGFFKKHLK